MEVLNGNRLTFLGHASFILDTLGGKRLVIDPFLADNPACPAEYKQPSKFGRVDAALVTHLHSDHADGAVPLLAANPDAVLFGMIETVSVLKSRGAKNAHPLNKGGGTNWNGIRITLTHAFHSSSGEDETGRTTYGGEAAGFIVRTENGTTIYAAGDTAVFGDMALIRELYAPDLGILPIGDQYTMGPYEAAKAVELLGLAHVVPMHYGTWPGLTGTPQEFQAQLTKRGVKTEVHVMEPGDVLE